ncbi:mannose-1-phosphate guanylyltransferase/mannose-6-phosphate isomerase [Paenalcaligenes faecalis]|uniref:mannose-1-phosphate guanylyltransferase/mannose-6-phosphate isomerase n=1 Tax=Paenalcaligenes faecalis TaxID=2980099 RepID=UPI0022B9A72F|nr:mannose-1-phosphate guanylyltransferase/mannose-6-phosphate isomerase [Paenalcaligenes faecalis]
MITPVVMAGGSGSRLWPLSRQQYPKQFLKLSGDHTLLQQTLLRLQGLEVSAPMIICNEDHRFLVAEQLRQINTVNPQVLLEPVGRNTAPAIALAALLAVQQDQDPILLVLAADHHIADQNAFQKVVQQAQFFAEQGQLVTFGIVPTHAETGYGYIHRGEALEQNGFLVAEFVEKPHAELAQSYLDSGDYYWNSGMFMFKASVYLQALQQFRPDILESCTKAIVKRQQDLDFTRIDLAAFQQCADESIDYAVMEKTADAVVVPLDAGWSDLGSWDSLWEIGQKDEQGNLCCGDAIVLNTTNSFVHSEHKLVATIGVEDLVIVETKDALLVAHKDKVQDIKQIVNRLQQAKRTEHINHREVYRPWGMYDSIEAGDRYQVKRISVKPGAKLSVQMHHHRAEHWVVVSGTAKVTTGERTYLVTENESTYIPIGEIHALENPGKIALELIEVQSGSYLGEDDIVRLEDRYGRG